MGLFLYFCVFCRAKCFHQVATLTRYVVFSDLLFLCFVGEEGGWGRVRGDLRGTGHGQQGVGGPQAGVGQTGQTGAQDGGGRAQETTR